jgi:hypothetical protein
LRHGEICGAPLRTQEGRGRPARVHAGECKKEQRRRIVYLSRKWSPTRAPRPTLGGSGQQGARVALLGDWRDEGHLPSTHSTGATKYLDVR